MKKHSEATQTLRAGCSKADPQTKHTHTHKQTNKQTHRGDYNTLRSLACSVTRKLSIAPTGTMHTDRI